MKKREIKELEKKLFFCIRSIDPYEFKNLTGMNVIEYLNGEKKMPESMIIDFAKKMGVI